LQYAKFIQCKETQFRVKTNTNHIIMTLNLMLGPENEFIEEGQIRIYVRNQIISSSRSRKLKT